MRLVFLAIMLGVIGCQERDDGPKRITILRPMVDHDLPPSTSGQRPSSEVIPSEPNSPPQSPGPGRDAPSASPSRNPCQGLPDQAECDGDLLRTCQSERPVDYDCLRYGYDACVWSPATRTSGCAYLRPERGPDVVIIGVSGHDRSLGRRNPEYLEERGTLDAIAAPIRAAGFSVEVEAFGDEYFTQRDAQGAVATRGFLDLLRLLDVLERRFVNRELEDGQLYPVFNPTRIIVVSHSHGVVWSHLALHVFEQLGSTLKVDLLIDLDGQSRGWERPYLAVGDRWAEIIYDDTVATGHRWPFEIWDPADTTYGMMRDEDIEDVVPDLALINLEVVARRLDPVIGINVEFYINDHDRNHRLDGSTDEILTRAFDLTHKQITYPNLQGIRWVVDQVRAIYGL